MSSISNHLKHPARVSTEKSETAGFLWLKNRYQQPKTPSNYLVGDLLNVEGNEFHINATRLIHHSEVPQLGSPD